MTADNFLGTIRRYTDAQDLSQRMVTELIDHIDIYHAEKVGGQTVQRITIFYNCMGAFTVPERESIGSGCTFKNEKRSSTKLA